MKVSELIDALKQYNQDAEVTRVDSETIYLSFVGESPDNTKVVFIEPRDYVDDRFDY